MAEPTASAYPAALDTAATLGADFVNAKTFILNADINNSTTSVVTTATISGFSANNWILIDSEIMWVDSISSATFTVVRARGGTAAATHSANAIIYTPPVAQWANLVRDAIIKIETELGTDPAGSVTDVDTRLDVALNEDGTLKTVAVAKGGTGATSLTDGGVLLGSGTGAVTAMSVLSDGEMIVGDGTTDPVAESGATLRTSIGVGSISTQAADAVNIDGGAIDGVTIGTNSAVTDLRVDNLKADGNTISVTNSNGDLTLTPNGTGSIIVNGPLQVDGTTTTVNSTTLTVDDPLIMVGGDSAPGSDDNKDRGIAFRWHNGSAAKIGFLGYDDSASKLTFIPDASLSSEVVSGTVGNVIFGNIEGTITTAAQNSITSASSLATVGTVGTGVWQGTRVAAGYGGTGIDTSGSTGVGRVDSGTWSVGDASLTADVSGTLPVANGGTNATSLADKAVLITQDSGTDTVAAAAMTSSGQILMGGSSGPAVGTITAGSGMTVTNGDGAITLAADTCGSCATAGFAVAMAIAL
jgi:hypothetical protein